MDTIVIKGRGENRGKYLQRRWPHGLMKPRVTTWVEKQSKAERFDWHEAERLLRYEIDGYKVELTAPAAILGRVEELKDFITVHAARAQVELDCHWVGGRDDGAEYCYDCCEEEVRKLRRENPEEAADIEIDGGPSTDHDSQPFCNTCGAKLTGSLTEHGVGAELAHFLENPPDFDSPEEWAEVEKAVMNLSDRDPRWKEIARWVDAAAEVERKHKEHLAQLAAAPGMKETRAALLGLLTARQEQVKAEPSFRLWAELQRYKLLPVEKRWNPKRSIRLWGKRLRAEAESFLGLLGYSLSGRWVKTPYGERHWEHAVETEQHRLWRTPAFLEGAAFRNCTCRPPAWARGSREYLSRKMKKRRANNRPLSRHDYCPHGIDANPYPMESRQHHVWALGYLSVVVEP